jgi:hypothetical protein
MGQIRLGWGTKFVERFGNSALHFLGFISAAGWEDSSQAVMSSLMYAA